jgi:hypothetical protein
MVQELNNIQKEAAGLELESPQDVQKAVQTTADIEKQTGEKAKEKVTVPKKARVTEQAPPTKMQAAMAKVRAAKDKVKGVAGKAVPKSTLGRVGAGLGAAGILAGGALGAHKLMKKKESSDSAFDTLVQQRALEHLVDAGYVDEEGNIYAPEQSEQQKTASDFNSVVDQAALTYLSELGYPIE